MEYEYEDAAGSAEDETAMTRAALARVPAPLVTAMRDATLAADVTRLTELIDQVAESDADALL